MDFQAELKKTLLSSLDNDYADNYDYYLFGPEDPGRWSKRWYRSNRWILPFITKRWYVSRLMRSKKTQFGFLYDRLKREQDKDLLLKLIAYRRLGWKKVRLPDSSDYFETMSRLYEEFEPVKGERLELPCPFDLFLTDLNNYGLPVRVFFHPLGIYYGVIKDQYQYPEAGITMDPGDHVLDAGACFGENALIFSHRVGKAGKVFAFEIVPENLAILHRNLDLNPALSERITVMDRPLAEETGKRYYLYKQGPASQISETEKHDGEVPVIVESMSVDDYVAQNAIQKLDFVKMDIEGAELLALKGAVKTIRKFKPKLAICIYHKPMDFDEIPKFIDALNLGYDFYLKHHGIQMGETVLYCKSR